MFGSGNKMKLRKGKHDKEKRWSKLFYLFNLIYKWTEKLNNFLFDSSNFIQFSKELNLSIYIVI